MLNIVRLQASGATFRGFVVQAREASDSFTNDAAFVGEFVNPPAAGDWKIWSCGTVSYFIKSDFLIKSGQFLQPPFFFFFFFFFGLTAIIYFFFWFFFFFFSVFMWADSNYSLFIMVF